MTASIEAAGYGAGHGTEKKRCTDCEGGALKGSEVNAERRRAQGPALIPAQVRRSHACQP